MSTNQKPVVKGGKLPLSQKSESKAKFIFEDFSLLTLDEELRKELEEKGLAYRWLNGSEHRKSGGYNAKGWKAYRRTTQPGADKSAAEFHYGTSPEGFIVRGDLILGVMPIERREALREYGAEKTARQSASTDENIKAFKEKARSAGARVHEGYEDNE